MSEKIEFFREGDNGFKDTEIGKIPKDWELVKLSDIAEDIHYGITAKSVENKTGLKMLRTTDIKDYTVDWSSLPFCEVTEKRGDIRRFLLGKGDLIIARAGTIGVSVLVEKDYDNVIFGSYLIKVKLSRQVHPKFMHYFCQSHLYWDHITSSQAGSTLKNISLPILKSLNVPLPSSVEEQQGIVSVLSTIDQAIQKTDEIISKLQEFKKGLMQRLLTKGIGHTRFKRTEIGEIPEEWDVVKLGDLFTVVTGTTPSIKEKRYWNDGTVNWLTPTDLSQLNGKIYIQDSQRKITELAVREYSLTKLPKGALIFSTRAPIGYVAIVLAETTFNQGCKGLIPKTTSRIVPEFYCYYLLFQNKTLQNLGGGSTFLELSKDSLERFKVPYPKEDEQKKIASTLFTLDHLIQKETDTKNHLGRTKKWFMNNLLTGKIRIKVS
jgi:type I restriction enzyme S subunit